MKKIMMGAAACALTSLFAGAALAAGTDGYYVSGNIGVAMPRDASLTFPAAPGSSVDVDYNSGLALGLALGYKFGPARVEGELAFQKSSFDNFTFPVGGGWTVRGPASGDVRTTSFLLNGYYDFANDSAFTPYLTAGLGFARVKASSDPWGLQGFEVLGVIPGWSDSDTVFAYQLGFGMEYALSRTVSLDARYRYFATSDPSFTAAGENFDAEFASHNLLLGVRVSF